MTWTHSPPSRIRCSYIMAEVVSLADVEKAIETVKQSPMVRRTPLLQNGERIFGFADQFKLHLKLESMQNTGMG